MFKINLRSLKTVAITGMHVTAGHVCAFDSRAYGEFLISDERHAAGKRDIRGRGKDACEEVGRLGRSQN